MATDIDNVIAGNVKVAMKDVGATSSDLWMVPYAEIHIIEGFNVRERTPRYLAHLESIKESIKTNGFYKDKPLEGYVIVKDGKNVIYATGGHTRYEAAGLAITEGADIKNLPIVIKPKGTSPEDLTVSLVTGNNGLPLEPFEIANVCKRLIDFNWEPKQIASKLNFTVQYVNDLLTLVSAPAAVRKLVSSGKISATLAISELKKAPEKAATVLKGAIEKAEARGKGRATKKDTAPSAAKEPKKPADGGKALALATKLESVSEKLAGAKETIKELRAAIKADKPKKSTQMELELSYDGLVDLAYTVMQPVFEAPEEIVRDLAVKVVAALFPAKTPVDAEEEL